MSKTETLCENIIKKIQQFYYKNTTEVTCLKSERPNMTPC